MSASSLFFFLTDQAGITANASFLLSRQFCGPLLDRHPIKRNLMFSKFERKFLLALCIMFSIAPVVWHSKGDDVLQLMPWAGLGIFVCLSGFILDRVLFKEKPSPDEPGSSE
ncbi:hypothetical protein ACM73L_33355 [Pseudomonas aeruginosa]|mgnify:CR=1 FL=1|uniref:hypothetical protein n=1 Tax=Ectopseudomonas TaxID=3236654 RepID=UPI002157C002|nr:hypothetical protein [Pseudomonas guguanensis]MCR7873091.1 hypothetical protein [Pseudomonas aeruginosa]MDR8015412.1 hypothetical protein [Pseudomonas guguanensis]HBP4949267.1 hypothetical protein [Pseudomonas aeruginosa]